jgi:hypothetical protein
MKRLALAYVVAHAAPIEAGRPVRLERLGSPVGNGA